MIFINYDIGCHIKVMSQKTYWRFPINLEKNISADFKLLLYFSNRYKPKNNMINVRHSQFHILAI